MIEPWVFWLSLLFPLVTASVALDLSLRNREMWKRLDLVLLRHLKECERDAAKETP
jgi:hypothetical protein